MSALNPFQEQVERNLGKLEARAEFDGQQLWLTFYISAPPGNLKRLSEALEYRGWTNLDGGQGGFLYPKVQVGRTVTAIVDAATATQGLCIQFGAAIDGIDADTTADMQSQFETLYLAPT